MQYTMKPTNKHVVIEPIDEANKVGSLYIPGNTSNQYRLGRLVAIAECDEAKDLNVGDTVLYDTIGVVAHRVGNQTITTMKVMNILGVMSEKQERPTPEHSEDEVVRRVPRFTDAADVNGKIGY